MPPNGKIGVHGLSMGGMIAVHLARKNLVEFLFVDRTFSDLSEVP
jgi:esterase/lipase